MNPTSLVRGQRFFGRHMAPGVAQYQEPENNAGEPYCILVESDVLKDMDPSYEGLSLTHLHVNDGEVHDEVSPQRVGRVVRSFFEPLDGCHWAEFIVDSEQGIQDIRSGWKLSNAYKILEADGGGTWHAVEYVRKVTKARYNHLALIPDPRYQESVIYDAEEFKAYRQRLQSELDMRRNSKEPSMWFTKNKADAEFEKKVNSLSKTLKSGREVTIEQLVNEAEASDEEKKKNAEMAAKAGSQPMVNGEHSVKLGEETISVNSLVERYNTLMKHHNGCKMNDETLDEPGASKEVDPKHNEKAPDGDEGKEKFEKKDNSVLSLDEQRKKIEADRKALEAREDAWKKKINADVKNARDQGGQDGQDVLETTEDRLARGYSMFGGLKDSK